MLSSASQSAPNGRPATYLEPDWERVAPCQWRADHQLGVNEDPLTLKVKLDDKAYRWEVLQGLKGMARGVCRTPAQARAAARRAAGDVTSTVRPSMMRQRLPGLSKRTTNNARSLDRDLLPFGAFTLLLANVGLNYYGVAMGSAQKEDLFFSVLMATAGTALFLLWQKFDRS